VHTFGEHLKTWRATRRMSQLDLGLKADASARHVSFLESGRARPSRAMVLRLAGALDMPRGAANAALRAAGFADAYPSLPLGDDALAPVRKAVDWLIARHAPLPGIAIDRDWNLIAANDAAVGLFGAPEDAPNVIDRLIALGDGDLIENWVEVALLARARLAAEIASYGGDEALEARLDRLAAHPRLRDAPGGALDHGAAVIPVRVNTNGVRLSLFSTIAQFGGVQEVNAADLRIELLFPADDATRAFYGAP